LFEKILSPLDGSPAAEAGLAWAHDAAARCGASLELLTIVDNTRAEANGHVQEAEEYLRAHVQRLEASGVPVTSNVAVGALGEQILSHASGAGLTVMTYHTSRWMFGGALDALLKDMVNPVIVVRAQEGHPPPAFDLSRILVPIGESARSQAAIPYAIDICQALGSQLILCNVVSPIPGAYDKRFPPPDIARAIDEQVMAGEQLLLSVAMEVGKQGVTPEQIVRVGEPAREIIAAARETGAGLITMTSRRADSMSRILESVAMGVVQASRVPSLLVRPPVAETATN
jgi:nucleotide-binding universal stress UspA family protein